MRSPEKQAVTISCGCASNVSIFLQKRIENSFIYDEGLIFEQRKVEKMIAMSSGNRSASLCCSSSNSSGDSRLCYFCAVSRRNVSLRSDLVSVALRLDRRPRRRGLAKFGKVSIACCLSDGSDDVEPVVDQEYLQASLLVSETMRHYNLRKQGFFEETRWHSNDQILPLSSQMNGTKSDVRSLGYGFLRRFHNPTIFLKVACDGPLLLPIIVGEFAIESLVDTLSGGKIEGYQDQFKFIKNLVGSLGYEVKMVRIVKRVVNTYYARIFLGKPSEGATLSIDSRPSDAIHLALKYQAPIYISKDIVVKDAIKIVYGTWNGSSVKTVYDVLLDSAPEGPDGLSEELDLIRKLNVAVREERFQDAAACRDQLSRFRLKGLSSSS